MSGPRVELVEALGAAEARAFAERWLPAWTGNDPERLVAFYTDDALYSDPAIPDGVRGREALLAYFRKLLGRNPAWVWTHRGSIPLRDGFLNEWHASIPAGTTTVEVDGVCSVQLRDGRIYRNHVYFDRSALLTAMATTKVPPQASRFAPAGWPVLTPRIVARDARELVAFVQHVFGATGDYQTDAPAVLRIGDSTVMVSDGAGVREPTAAFLYVYVDDVDRVFRRALEAGARALEEPKDLPYGDRRGMVEDAWGNTWQIATHRGRG